MFKNIISTVLSAILLFSFVGIVSAAGCGDSSTGCGGGGCGAGYVYVCPCLDCRFNGYGSNPMYECGAFGGCSCERDTSCVTCNPDCTNKTCGGNGCGGSCGSCSSGVCSSGTCCVNVAPAKPVLSTPVTGTQIRVGTPTTLTWGAIASWGNACTTPSNRYQVCVSGNQTTCDLVNYVSVGTSLQYSWTPTVADSNVTWAVRANNGVLTNQSLSNSVCVEGFDPNNTAYLSNWSACDATPTHTRTCVEDCGTDDCSALSLTESCTGRVSGTIFDASNLSTCPGFDSDGYSVGLAPGLGAASRSFGFSDQSSTSPHPYSLLSPATTDANGNYSISVYAPATYEYDFSPLSDILVISDPPKLSCISLVADVPTNPVNCLSQPCSIVNGMSFGFWKNYGGWWQAVGGNIHADQGLKSEIPSSLPLGTEMSLILPDASMGDKRGFVSYGVPRDPQMLGANLNAKVSTKLWEKESKYGGVIYDWGFYNTRFNLFSKTIWTEGQSVDYNATDTLRGYKILSTDAGVTAFSYSPGAGEYVIFHVNGDVRVTSNLIVPNTSFLAIIAKGTITFGPTLTRADGWFIGNTLAVPCADIGSDGCDKTDSLFSGNGTFIGWSSISLSRNRGLTNNTAPSEKFTYRQDLYLNTPDPMKVFTKVYKPFIP